MHFFIAEKGNEYESKEKGSIRKAPRVRFLFKLMRSTHLYTPPRSYYHGGVQVY